MTEPFSDGCVQFGLFLLEKFDFHSILSEVRRSDNLRCCVRVGRLRKFVLVIVEALRFSKSQLLLHLVA